MSPLTPAEQKAREIVRFEKHFKKTDGCWIWTGCASDTGYGSFRYEGRMTRAHRASYSIYVSDPPKDMMVCHSCDVKLCVNPEHLFIGTSSDNVRDCVAKKRQMNSRKTECLKGHPFDAENTRIRGRWRTCKKCQRIRSRAYTKRVRSLPLVEGEGK